MTMSMTMRALLLAALLGCSAAGAQDTGTAFSFQGRLHDAGIPVDGSVALRITPFDSETGGTSLAPSLETGSVLEDGVFTTVLDFGPAVFLGTPVWLEVEVDADGGGHVLMSPRLQVSPTPYAMHAQSVAVDSIDGLALQDGAVTATKIAAGSVGAAQVDSSEVQRRIGPDCAPGSAIAAIAQDGTTSCVPAAAEGSWANNEFAVYTGKKVRVGTPGPTAPMMSIDSNSAVSSPQLELRESDQDFARLTFRTQGTTGAIHGNYWTIAARTEPDALGGPGTDRINFYNNRTGDVMSLLGNGRLGIGTANPAATLDVNGTARVRALADAGATINRAVHVQPDGDLVVAGSAPSWMAVPATAFRTHLGDSSPDSGPLGLLAPVILPHGTRVTALRLNMVDNVSGTNYISGLLLMDQGTTDYESALVITTSGASSAVRSFDSEPGSVVIDNENMSYALLVLPTGGSWQGSDSEIVSVRLRIE